MLKSLPSSLHQYKNILLQFYLLIVHTKCDVFTIDLYRSAAVLPIRNLLKEKMYLAHNININVLTMIVENLNIVPRQNISIVIDK